MLLSFLGGETVLEVLKVAVLNCLSLELKMFVCVCVWGNICLGSSADMQVLLSCASGW